MLFRQGPDARLCKVHRKLEPNNYPKSVSFGFRKSLYGGGPPQNRRQKRGPSPQKMETCWEPVFIPLFGRPRGRLGGVLGRLGGLLVANMAQTRPPKLDQNPIKNYIKIGIIFDSLGRAIFFDLGGFVMPKWSPNGLQILSNFDINSQKVIFYLEA